MNTTVQSNSLAPTSELPPPDISVVIVSWNVAGLLADCLDSLVRCADGLALEVWVVDNASSDNTVEMVQTRYSWVHLIANPDNRGFARANNQAFQQARGRFVLILNPDTIIQEGAIRSLFQFLAEHGDVGMVGPRQIDANGKIVIACARRLLTLSAVLWIQTLKFDSLPWVGAWTHHRLVNPYDYGVTQEVEAISGAAMLVRREILEDMQGFGETFIHSFEDIDLCFRIRAAGWKIYYCSAATIIHLVGQSTKQASLRSTMDMALSREEYFVRCHGKISGWLCRFIFQAVFAPSIAAMGCLKYLAGKESSRELKQRLNLAFGLLMRRTPK